MRLPDLAWRSLVLVVVSLAAAAAGCGAPQDVGKTAAAAPLHGPPLEFSFDSLDDRALNDVATRGKPTVLAFVTTSNLPSQAQVDFLVAMAKHDAARAKHDAESVNYGVVALETSDNRELVGLYKKALSISFPVALADARTLSGAGPFGDVSGVPVVVVLDRAGRVVSRSDGRVVKSDELRAAIRGL